MRVCQIVFSPTGGTQQVADALAAGFGQTGAVIDLTSDAHTGAEFGADDLAILAVPSYGGRVPALAAERLSRLRGNGCAAILVCAYGNRAYEDTLRELQSLAEGAGFRPVAAVAAVAEHSIARQYAGGRPDAADRAELLAFAEQIRKQQSATDSGLLRVPGKVPDRAAAGGGMVPRAGRNCIECGQCARECPAHAIDPARLRSADRRRCISCMRCVKLCPQGARRLSPLLVKAAGLMLRKGCRERKNNEVFLRS